MDRKFLLANRVRGFTLIELVVVITILGILAAFAVPRFIALQTQARAASIQSLSGALRSAASMTHGMWLITGGTTIAMEGANITMTNGYPTYADIALTLQDASGFNYDSTTGQFSKVGAATPTKCSVTYTPPIAAGVGPTFFVDQTDCS